MKHILPVLILALATLGVTRAAYSLWQQGAFELLLIWWRGASRLMRGFVLALVLTAVAYGSDKILGGHIGEGMRMLGGTMASLCTNVFTSAERQTGYAASWDVALAIGVTLRQATSLNPVRSWDIQTLVVWDIAELSIMMGGALVPEQKKSTGSIRDFSMDLAASTANNKRRGNECPEYR